MNKIASALVKAQQAFGPALKEKMNPAFRSKYADLGACIEAVIDGLNANGIALIQKQHQYEGGVCIETVFLHESGEMFSAGLLSVPAVKKDPQGYGSALTYARRYSLMSACGIAPEDDDGNAASKQRPAPAAHAPAPEPAPDVPVSNAETVLMFLNSAAKVSSEELKRAYTDLKATPDFAAVWLAESARLKAEAAQADEFHGTAAAA